MQDGAVGENKSGYCCRAVSVRLCALTRAHALSCVCTYSYLPECPGKYLHQLCVCVRASVLARCFFLCVVCLRGALNFERAYESVLFISAFACNHLGFNMNMCAHEEGAGTRAYVCVCVRAGGRSRLRSLF